MPTHIIHFCVSVTPSAVEQLRNCALRAIQEQGATELQIHISSEGGNLAAGFTAYNFLRSLPIPVTTHNVGNVESIAVVIFLAGSTRLICPHARFNIHPLHWGFSQGAVDHDRLAEFADSLEFDAERYARIFEERTDGANKPMNVRAHLSGRANILGADAAIAAGMASAAVDATATREVVHWWLMGS